MAIDLFSAVHSPARLTALRRLALLDTPPEPQFERLTRLATELLDAPIALISLVDDSRQFFKSLVGLSEPWASRRETPLTHSFCQYIVATRQPLVVRDARRHPILQMNPAVPELGVVAYAGVPLTLDEDEDEIIGSFCVIDSRPRNWSKRQLEQLSDLAQVTMSEIRLRASHQLTLERRSDRTASEEQLRLYREIIANSSEAIAIVDQFGCYTEQNASHRRLVGYSDAELQGQTPAIHLGSRTFSAVLDSLLTNGQYRGEVTSTSRSGIQREIELSAFAIRDDDQQPICYVGIKRDITERKRAEEALRRRFEQLQAVYYMADTVTRAADMDEIYQAAVSGLRRALNTDCAAVLLFDADGVMRFKAWYGLSEQYRRLVEGHSPWQQDTINPQPVLVPDVIDEPSLIEFLPGILSEGIRSMAFIPLLYSGRLLGKFMLYYDTPHQFTAEEIQLAQTIANHIAFATERRRDEQAQSFLIEASTLLVSLLDYEQTVASIAELAVPRLADWCIIDMLDQEGRLQQMAISHVDPQRTARVRELRRRYPPDADEPHPIWKVLRDGRSELRAEISDAELASRARDPEHLELLREIGICSHMIVPLIARGRTLGAISFVAGVSGRRYGWQDLALAEELARRAAFAVDNARLYNDAQQALKARDQFLSIAAHELKTPITALLGYAQLMERRAQREGETSQRDQVILRTLIDQSRRLHRLSVSLLELSRIQIGSFSIERGRLDIAGLARRVIDELQPTVDHHSLTYKGPESLMIEGDELRLEQVLLNLLHNAIKYSPDGGPVLIRLSQSADWVRISVSDHGIGIPADSRSRLFSRFFRASNVDPQQISGMGLGLYVVREIVTLHGGRVMLRSKEGRGSTFFVCLPRQQDPGTLSAHPTADV